MAAADINGDGAIELVAADARGNVAAFSADGTELWERHVKSLISQVAQRKRLSFALKPSESLIE